MTLGATTWPWSGKATSAATQPLPGVSRVARSSDTVITSPRPFFVPLNGQGPSLSSTHVVWTATNGEGVSGSEDDRIFAADLKTKHVDVVVHSVYGANGIIGSYVLAGMSLAYVDTGFTTGGILPWRVDIVDLKTKHVFMAATLAAGVRARIPPQIAYDGTHLLILETADAPAAASTTRGAVGRTRGTVVLYSTTTHQSKVLTSALDVLYGDPALATGTALWTTTIYTSRLTSALTTYDLARHVLGVLPVGIVSQTAAGGDSIVWKTGLTGVPGLLQFYSLKDRRLLSANLSGTDTGTFPEVNGSLVSWTDTQGQRIQIYSTAAGRIVYSASVAPDHHYGLTAIAAGRVVWVYTVAAIRPGGPPPRGYVVVHTPA